MSYLDLPRLTFSGDFQADVSTVNNDVRHFESAMFEPRFQDLQQGRTLNGWWNPTGSGAFGLIGCRVRQATYIDGSAAIGGSDGDPVIGLAVGGADDRVSAKLVDIDPQWQLCSQIWGMTVRLTDDQGPFLSGRFEVAAFRDLWFGRLASGGDGSASAVFTSVLSDISWSCGSGRSRLLDELRAASADGCLSIRLTTFGFFARFGAPRFTVGRVVGAIGPWRQGEPRRFALGRRFAPSGSDPSPQGVTFFDGSVDEAGTRVTLDLSNALPLADPFGVTKDIGPVALAVLKTPDNGDGRLRITQGQSLSSDQFISLGAIDYRRDEWIMATSGLVDLPIVAAAQALVKDHPLALVAPQANGATVLVREMAGGLFSRADDFVQRVDAAAAGTVDAAVAIYATRFGRPLADTEIELQLVPPQSGLGGGSSQDPAPPQAPIPDIGTPPAALNVPASARTGANGRAQVTVAATNPANPRGYIDGQIYLVSYQVAGQQATSPQVPEVVVLHVRDAFTPPAQPTWADDVAPILMQYGNLYPIMSRWLVDLGDYDAVVGHREILEFAFSRPIEDPNYMPATRDLSAGKLAMILAWLRAQSTGGAPLLRHGPRRAPAPPPVARAAAAAAVSAGGEAEVGAKEAFLRSLRRALGRAPDDPATPG